MLESLFIFNKVADLQACNFIKKRLQHRCFPVKFTKSLKTPVLKNIYERPLLLFQWRVCTILKSGSHLPKTNWVICFIESPFKMIKHAFYFILKVLFVLKIFKVSSWIVGHVDGNFIYNGSKCSVTALQTILRDKETVEIKTPNLLVVTRKQHWSFR